MKNNFLLVILGFIIVSTSAQTEKGTWLVNLNGTIGLNQQSQKIVSDNSDEDFSKTFNFSVAPTGGYFIANNLVVGSSIQYSYFKNTFFENFNSGQGDFESTSTSYVFTNFWRYYFKVGKVLPFINTYAGIGFGQTESSFNASSNKISTLNFGVGPGLAIPIGKKVTFDLIANWNRNVLKSAEGNPNNQATITTSIVLSTGFSVFLN